MAAQGRKDVAGLSAEELDIALNRPLTTPANCVLLECLRDRLHLRTKRCATERFRCQKRDRGMRADSPRAICTRMLCGLGILTALSAPALDDETTGVAAASDPVLQQVTITAQRLSLLRNGADAPARER